MRSPAWSTIEDPEDPRLDAYRNLRDADARRALESRHGVFVAEGITVIRRLLQSPFPVRSLLLLPQQAERLAPDLAEPDPAVPHPAAPDQPGPDQPGLDRPRPELAVFVAERAVLADVAGFDVHRGALAIAERLPLRSVEDVLAGAHAVAVLEGLNDHENLGAIARSASAFGVDALLLDPTCADPLYRRTVRVSMGEILFLPWTRLAPWPTRLDAVRAAGLRLLALTPSAGADPIDEVLADVPGPVALLLGAEGPGLSAGALAAADHQVRIPIRAGVDSLNVGHAAAIAFHALARRAA